MTGTMESTTGRRRRVRQAFAFAALCTALVGVLAVSTAGARDAKVLGKTKRTPDPACLKACNAVGSVTAFQLAANGEKRPFNVRRKGKLVAWAIDLSKPRKSQRRFFGDVFESPKFGKVPTARIAVIKHKRRAKYKLIRQSPAVGLSSALGRKQVFTLEKPLRVRKGQVVALTVSTWASNFAVGIRSRGNRWRGSRERSRCDTQELRNAKRSRPHQNVDSVRNYGCEYSGARLLYWAYYVRG